MRHFSKQASTVPFAKQLHCAVTTEVTERKFYSRGHKHVKSSHGATDTHTVFLEVNLIHLKISADVKLSSTPRRMLKMPSAPCQNVNGFPHSMSGKGADRLRALLHDPDLRSCFKKSKAPLLFLRGSQKRLRET